MAEGTPLETYLKTSPRGGPECAWPQFGFEIATQALKDVCTSFGIKPEEVMCRPSEDPTFALLRHLKEKYAVIDWPLPDPTQIAAISRLVRERFGFDLDDVPRMKGQHPLVALLLHLGQMHAAKEKAHRSRNRVILAAFLAISAAVGYFKWQEYQREAAEADVRERALEADMALNTTPALDSAMTYLTGNGGVFAYPLKGEYQKICDFGIVKADEPLAITAGHCPEAAAGHGLSEMAILQTTRKSNGDIAISRDIAKTPAAISRTDGFFVNSTLDLAAKPTRCFEGFKRLRAGSRKAAGEFVFKGLTLATHQPREGDTAYSVTYDPRVTDGVSEWVAEMRGSKIITTDPETGGVYTTDNNHPGDSGGVSVYAYVPRPGRAAIGTDQPTPVAVDAMLVRRSGLGNARGQTVGQKPFAKAIGGQQFTDFIAEASTHFKVNGCRGGTAKK